MSFESGRPSASSARAYASAASGDRAMSSAPMPTYWEPWPGKTSAMLRRADTLVGSVSWVINLRAGEFVGEYRPRSRRRPPAPWFAARPAVGDHTQQSGTADRGRPVADDHCQQ